jgi:RimJ/RimL family protein N-acetyltransferase
MTAVADPCQASRCTRLLLRAWVEADAAGLREAIDEDLAHLKPWMTWTLEEPATLEQTRARIAGYIDQSRTGRAYRYAITPADRPSLILGAANLYTRAGPYVHDVGYWVRKSAARQGIAGSAVSALLVEAFRGRGVRRVIIQCDVANVASAAFARHLGFQSVGTAERTHPDGSPRPILEFEMTREAYLRQYEPALRDRARRVRFADGGAVE